MQEHIKHELNRALENGLEVDILLEGGSIYPSLVVFEKPEDSSAIVTFIDSHGATFTLSDDTIRGIVVNTTAPRWAVAQRAINLEEKLPQRQDA